ncbi:2-amino-4-hydroxy-6-hydroxymethyldihydropteridine diphosphokinase [Lichenicola cladoniae]|uniref:2-amino-4-hydroxy-6-hydroxymethyldihydropteridine pyrophosphokinase n=1 Tax=Lichenicola cladoniae TaxID=1484109 RepID=A0A6M8HWJ6_9PROT|nr:2-amino-4-hydroxy-6-hydroxymethyldihydropteridine diphosphokinase [Lichenicola cladoniae]NPD66475.1 2-amino-4-hydroxy-6-hydroxymethyldihydropteridine diphosphokinase [Acetobacteraceae bacterium]QKE92565.1 2-amino-4-hydroxy-6-hydroxymethyldihydropteridine diphosphokinase [Lichenicola cladoniae]
MILIAVGANLSAHDGRTSYQVCTEAVDALARLPGIRLVAMSPWYRSAPVPRSDQPDYLNGVARLAPTGSIEPDPATLLAMLQEIEQANGRERSVPNAARTLDLDIIAMGEGGQIVREQPDPVLPHPRAHLRAFVLLPVQDVAPDWVHPGLGCIVRDLISGLPAGQLHRSAISLVGEQP